MKKIIPGFVFMMIIFVLAAVNLHAQLILSSWTRNTTGETGYDNIIANVDSVMYSDSSVYIRAAGIPSYTIGPWTDDPNTPRDQQYLYKFPRYPQKETGSKVPTPLAAEGLLLNGVPVFNAEDGLSYNNQNVWHSNAGVVEGISFDSSGGHPDSHGAYHYHENPKYMYPHDSTQHSPIIGYAFDGYPIYGPYAYKNTDGTGGIIRMTSSYQLKSDTTRINGPSVSQYPLGVYVEDYEYVAGSGTLDQYNGRFAVTPQYPNGTYAYYLTVNSDGTSAYPYIIGPEYYGVPDTEDFNNIQVTISEPVIKYTGQTTGVKENLKSIPSKSYLFQNYPDPFNPTTTIRYQIPKAEHITLKVYDELGREVKTLVNGNKAAGQYNVTFNCSGLASGIYYYRITAGNFSEVKKLILLK